MTIKPSFIEILHSRFIILRRIRVLAGHISPLLPVKAKLLDVGCGDGILAAQIMKLRPDVSISGIDVLARENPRLDVQVYDGKIIPFRDDSFDCVLLADVLHHSEDIPGLLRECARVAGHLVIIKDHLPEGLLARRTLDLMDRVGNARFGVSMDCTYLNRKQWTDLFSELGLGCVKWSGRLGIYPWPLSMVFDRGLHFLAQLNTGEPKDGLSG